MLNSSSDILSNVNKSTTFTTLTFIFDFSLKILVAAITSIVGVSPAQANTISGLLTNDYLNDPNFQVYQDNFNRGMQQAYDTNVLGNLTDRGLMRSSGLQAATNSFNNTMQQGLADLYDSYYNRQQNNLNSALNAQNNLYSWITGLNQDASKNSQAVSNHYMEAYKADQALKGAMYQALGQAVGGLAGSAGGGKK